jgi:hypothetical protein
MSDSCVVNLFDDERYVERLVNILMSFRGKRKLEYVTWLKSIGLEVQYR